jgi:hypothetical protein
MKASLGQAAWRTSSYSGGAQNCIQVAGTLTGAVAVRDSKDPGGPALVLTPAAWRALTHEVKNHEIALARSHPVVEARAQGFLAQCTHVRLACGRPRRTRSTGWTAVLPARQGASR